MSEHAFQLDDEGRKVLIGLSFEETEEYFVLERALADKLAPMSSDEWTGAGELRWLELSQKHEAAALPFLSASKTLQ